MKTKDYYFDLPIELVAQLPSEKRGEDKLLVVNKETKSICHSSMKDFVSFLPKNSLIVVNNTKVRKARTYAKSDTNAKVEFLFTKRINSRTWLCIVSKSRKQVKGKHFTFENGYEAYIQGDEDNQKIVEFTQDIDESFFDTCGHMPLPPYIKREDLDFDSKRYQTIYAQNIGSIASPTAGLHFTQEIMDEIKKNNHEIVEVTLHVGLGTFLPVRTENIEDHIMHSEVYNITKEVSEKINNAIKNKQNIVAVGTTSVRTLESSFDKSINGIRYGENSTSLFIKPGYKFNVVNSMFTNFHTPESTLLVLVSTFAGKDLIVKAYKEAVEKRYMFFSYGDAMFIV